jgi:hypothetical protein
MELEQAVDNVVETKTSRLAFVKKLGTLAAVGAGLALIPARAAKAANSFCCPPSGSQCSGQSCTNGLLFHCSDNCTQGSCCVCFTTHAYPNCFEIPCVC